MQLFQWIKTHKLLFALGVVILFLLLRPSPMLQLPSLRSSDYGAPSSMGLQNLSLPNVSSGDTMQEKSYVTNPTSRMVTKDSDISLVVKDVNKAGEQIIVYAKSQQGYMVSASYNRPGESAFGTITIRVNADRIDQTIAYIKSLGLKVTNENLIGTDVTDQYTDIQARLTTLQTTQTKFQEILAKATNVQDILTVQRELITLQDQIDAIKGQQKALEQNVKLTRITVYLSTDELALPYVPDNVFRPDVIFKQAVRSLVDSFRQVGAGLIWVGVYSIIWLPVLVIFIVVKRWRKRKITS